MARTVGVVFGLFHFWFFAPEETTKTSYGEIASKTEVPKHTTDFHTSKTSHWSKFLSWGVDTVKIYHTGFVEWEHGALWNAIEMNGHVSNPLLFFQASSFQLLKLENLLRWSFFTLIYNRSSNIWIISCILHIISLLTGDMNSINWPRSQCVAS